MAQIAKEAGVSTTTVSKVLNQLPGVGASTRARIQQMIEQYDYVQNHAVLCWLLRISVPSCLQRHRR